MKKRVFAPVRVFVLLLLAAMCLSAFTSCGEKVLENGKLDLLNMDMSRYIELGDYSSLSYTLEIAPVTESDVEGAFFEFQSSLQIYDDYVDAPVSRATVENDCLQISYVGRVDGEIVDNSANLSTTPYLILADGNGYYDWFNNALLGIYAGDTVTAEGQLADSENYGEYAGKNIVYEITLVAIMGHYTFTEVTDEVVLEKTGYATIEEYKASLYDSIEAARKQAALESICQEVWEKAQELSKVRKYPQKQVEYYYNAFYGNYEYIAYQSGVPIETVLAQKGKDEGKIREMAKVSVAEEMFYYAVVQDAGLEVTDEEYAERVGTIAEMQGTTVEALEAEYGVADIRDSMLFDEALLYVANAVDVTYTYTE